MIDFSTPVSGEPVRKIPSGAPPPVETRKVGRSLWRGAGFIILGGILMTALAGVVLGLIPPTYTSRIQVLVDPSDPRTPEGDGTSRAAQTDAAVAMAESQVRVVRSDSVLRRVVETLHLDQDDEFARPDAGNSVADWFRGSAGTPPQDAGRDRSAVALETLQRNLTVQRPDRTFIIDVAVQSRDPAKAAQVANAIADAYLAEEAAARLDIAKRASDIAAGRLAILKRDVEEAERQVVRYREEHRLAATGGRPLSDWQVGDLNQQYATAVQKTAEAKSRLEQARKLRPVDPGAALPDAIQSPEMQALRQQYAPLARSTAEMATRLGDRHPVMAEQNAKLRDLQRQIQREKERIVESLQKDVDRAVAAEAALRTRLDRVKTETTATDKATVGLRDLERVAEAKRGVYEAYLRGARETGEVERPATTNLRVISAATPAPQRTFPPSPMVVLPIAFLVGLALGTVVALVLGADAERRRSRRPVEPPRSLRAADA
jgi:uncharacterized protein involved in exopolysaccharide biosynthesis